MEARNWIEPLTDGTAKWARLPVPVRSAISLCVISQLAVDGSLSMAEYQDRKPEFMPSAGAIALLFEGWRAAVIEATRSDGASFPNDK